MTTMFLFMDEKYADRAAEPDCRVTALTGVLIPTGTHAAFRKRFYEIISDILPAADGVVPAMPLIHASSLLPDAPDDDVRCRFLGSLIDLVLEFDFRVYRIGYYTTAEALSLFKTEKALIGLCFQSMLNCLESELLRSQIWPIMEIDRSPDQDKLFAGSIQNLDYYTSRLRPGSVSFNNQNLGEVLYTTKRSSYGCIVDSISYLLHIRFLRLYGKAQTAFKERLADVASKIEPAIARNEVIKFRVQN
nr:hypothetical protein [uncultured Rhodopila sp.]